MKVVPVEKKSYGKFHTGDSYILLHVGCFSSSFIILCPDFTLKHKVNDIEIGVGSSLNLAPHSQHVIIIFMHPLGGPCEL